ncbi:hypothetical protein [Bosea massiliensis]|uniref:Uncharacterized protein n=1 Tax=Bosea massiliensis TaxID=151419 RepID=A0ABW0P0X7_9HYPH
MSLDVYLKAPDPIDAGTGPRIFIKEDGSAEQISREEWDRRFPGREPVMVESEPSPYVFTANITHNLNKMATAAGIYQHLWRPEEIGITEARQLVEPLEEGMKRLRADPEHFKTFNAPNGWGKYENLIAFVDDYVRACKAFPSAEVSACR